MERWLSGRKRTTRNRLIGNYSWVRIPPSPFNNLPVKCYVGNNVVKIGFLRSCLSYIVQYLPVYSWLCWWMCWWIFFDVLVDIWCTKYVLVDSSRSLINNELVQILLKWIRYHLYLIFFSKSLKDDCIWPLFSMGSSLSNPLIFLHLEYI